MSVCHPIRIEYGIYPWQVLPQCDGLAPFCFGGTADNLPGTVFFRILSEKNGKSAIDWTPVLRSGEKWSAQGMLPVGGPYRIETCAKEGNVTFSNAVGGDMCSHVFSGDLFLIAGQSNAVGYARDFARDDPCIGVSVLRLNGKWDLASHPLHDGTGCISDILEVPMPAHSPWLAFAKKYYFATGIPVGLLPAAMGGSPMDAWEPGAGLYLAAVKTAKTAGKLKGIIWYQGCADALALQHSRYLQRFSDMAAAFRQELNQPELPFFTFQLNGFTESVTQEVSDAFSTLREAQRRATEQPGIYLIPTAGLPMYDQIHNSAASNCKIGRQTADLAMAILYGMPYRKEPLAVQAYELSVDRLTLTVGPVTGKLCARKNSISAFEAFIGSTSCSVEKLKISGNQIILIGKNLGKVSRFCYAQGADITAAGIYDSDGNRVLQPFVIDTDCDRK